MSRPRWRGNYAPAGKDYLPKDYDTQTLLDFTDFMVRCLQGSVCEPMRYITSSIIEAIRMGRRGDARLILAKSNQVYKALVIEFPENHAIWNYVVRY